MKMIKLVLVISLLFTFNFSGVNFSQLYSQNQNIQEKKTIIVSQLKPLPDLVISKVTFFPNDVLKAHVTIHNKGLGNSAPCVLQLSVGCGPSTIKYITKSIPGLKGTKPGAWPDPKSQTTVIFKSPKAFNISNIIFTIDFGNNVKEAKEDNNKWEKNNCIK